MAAMFAYTVMAARSARKLRKNEMHEQTLVTLIVLSIGVALGCSFRGVFLVANKGCDEVVDAIESNPLELSIDVMDCGLMTVFPLVSLFYLFQRCAHGHMDARRRHDYAVRTWVNVSIAIVWVKIIVQKGYVHLKEICAHSDREGFWCHVEVRNYTCHRDLEGLQAAWYYVYVSLLEPATMSCISEYLPVLLVAHWLACGGGQRRTEQSTNAALGVVDQLRQRLHHVHVTCLRPLVKCSQSFVNWKCWNTVLLSLAIIAMLVFVESWFVVLYGAMAPGPPAPDFVDDGKVAGYDPLTLSAQFIRLGVRVVLFSTALMRLQSVPAEKLDSAHMAAARGDTTLLLGSLVAMSFGYLVEIAHWQNLRMAGYTSSFMSWWCTSVCLISLIAEWLHLFALRRIVALRDAELKTYKLFLPCIALASFIANFYYFIQTFLILQRTSTYLKMDGDYRFPADTLLSEILGNLLAPADFLYDFTAMGLWANVLMRYLSMGCFDIGYPPQPRVTTC